MNVFEAFPEAIQTAEFYKTDERNPLGVTKGAAQSVDVILDEGTSTQFTASPTAQSDDILIYALGAPLDTHACIGGYITVRNAEWSGPSSVLHFAWTGPADASPSTLSKDGTLVATNQATDPNVTQTLKALTHEGTWARAADSSSPSGYLWTFTPASINWQWLGSLMLSKDSTQLGALAGQSMHVLMWAGQTMRTSDIGLKISSYNGSSWSGLGDGIDIAYGDAAWCHVEFTMPSGLTLLRLNSNYGIGTSGNVTIGPVMMLTDDDYMALQALGVDWFSGSTQDIVLPKYPVAPLSVLHFARTAAEVTRTFKIGSWNVGRNQLTGDIEHYELSGQEVGTI